VSLGVASFPQGGTELEALVASVERALRQAQKRGMNCVEVMTGVTPDTGAQLRRIPSLERQSPRRLA
jgi:predicted signal transduction protein with EAL and GGDEF domain